MALRVEPVAGGKVRLVFTLAQAERERFERRALLHLAQEVKIDGFRPGHAPETELRKHVGPEALREELVLQAVRELYPEAVQDQGLEVIGRPAVSVDSQEPFTFSVVVAQLPKVDLGKWEKVSVKPEPVEVKPEEVSRVLQDIREHRAVETVVEREARIGDRVEVDFDITVDSVAIDGGSQKKYPAILGKGQLVPGFEDNLVGLKPGEAKQFAVIFPKDYQKHLAGKTAQVSAILVQVFERTLPELTDEFARTVGRFSSADDLREKLHQNLLDEAHAREEERLERKLLEALLAEAHFGEIPEILLQAELEKMLHEFRHGIEQGGHGQIDWQQYLTSIKKDEAGLRQDLQPGAAKRVQVALITRTLAKQQSLEADDAAVEAEIEAGLSRYGGDAHMQEQMQSDDYREYMRNMLTNRRVLAWLKEKLVK